MQPIDEARKLFEDRFGSCPEAISIAPGRINLIGEHTDYSDGFVFPVAIDRHIAVAASATDGPSELFSSEFGESTPFDVGQESPKEGWGRYAAGMAWTMRRAGLPLSTNIQAVVCSDLPTASGVSSSAALELAFAVLWNHLDSLGADAKRLALLAQECEHVHAGVQCGVMDQLACALGRAGHAMFIDTRTLDVTYAKIPAAIEIVLCDTGSRRDLGSAPYNERRESCTAASQALGVKALRDASLSDLNGTWTDRGSVLYRRAHHVVSENERCKQFLDALSENRLDQLGAIMAASHESLRSDFEVSSDGLNAMVEAARRSAGCIGVRLTGAGFGGACVALVQANQVKPFVTQTEDEFRVTEPNLNPNLLVCQAVDGARVIG
ncbi:MAG: galactokinase [Armatimonadetes bacterium]|nr:galactokinase [Armatimonadota bacterium]